MEGRNSWFVGSHCYKVATNLAELFMKGRICTKQSIEDVAWVFLTAYSKMTEERIELKKELLSKNKQINKQKTQKTQNLEIWNILSLFVLIKKKSLF